MNKAEFDRRYKAIKGHMLNRVIVLNTVDDVETPFQIENVYWDDLSNALVIKTEAGTE